MSTCDRTPQLSLRRWASSMALGLAPVAFAAAAAASPDYPAELQEKLDMACAPPCTACHRDLQGGIGTVIKPFGDAMIRGGLTFNKADLIESALAVLEDPTTGAPDQQPVCAPDGVAPCDSDGDGTPDVAELRAGTDPNEAGKDLCVVKYGCGGHVEPRGRPLPERGALVLAALAAVALISSSRRRRAR